MTKVSRTFRIEQKLSKALDKLYTRHGDNTYHLEQALSQYGPIKALDKAKTVIPVSEKVKRFTPPTQQEVGAYFLQKGSTDAVNEGDKFFYFYDSKDWKVGKNKMKSWKSAANGWMSRNKTGQAPSLIERHQDTSWADKALNIDKQTLIESV